MLKLAYEAQLVNVEMVYSYLIDSTWLFLGSWVVLLLMAGVVAFAPFGGGRLDRGVGDWPSRAAVRKRS